MKAKTIIQPCRFCKKEFQRKEHLLRHERTHTKEKPFVCFCNKSFSRRDLLSRHTRLAHEESVEEDLTIVIPTDQNTQHDASLGQGSQTLSYPISSATDLVPSIERPSISHQTWLSDRDINLADASGMTDNQFESNSAVPPTGQVDGIALDNDLDILWSDFDMYSNLMLPTSYATDYPMNYLSLARYGIFESPNTQNHDVADEGGSSPHNGALSRYASRLPSVQPQPEHNPIIPNESGETSPHRRLSRNGSSPRRIQPWRISREEYQQILTSLKHYRSLLPSDFEFPSRHALCRYTEGYFSGFHEHLPFIHLPTVSMVTMAPELVLAIAAVGAQYRFQRTESYKLYDAARALVEQQIRRRDGYGAPPSVLSDPSMLSDGNLPYHSTRGDTSVGGPTSASAQSGTEALDESAETILTMQAMILLIALGTWNHKSLLKDALSMASQLAMLVRECGTPTKNEPPTTITFEEWVCSEGQLRTKLVAYAFLNLHSIAYDIAPKLMNNEIRLLQLPSPESHWRASDQSEWLAARHREPYSEVTVDESYHRLLTDDAHRRHQRHPISSFGNYILIHCIIQQIFFTRQSNLDLHWGQSNTLPPETLTRLQSALRHWQQNWEAAKDSSIDPSAPGGPLSFNSTALFRVAYIRIHADIGPCRQLESRDPMRIANALHQSPHLVRSPDLCRAVLQCAHSLSIPVRIGIEFVARTQSLTWSIVHSLCNLECAFFLSKWLESVAALVAAGEELREDEKKLLTIVKSILSETSLKHSFQTEEWGSRTIQRMGAAVVRLWGETFKGAHVFEIMGVIGAALGNYASCLDRELDT